jgi:hypothetical protein
LIRKIVDQLMQESVRRHPGDAHIVRQSI